MLNNYFFNNRIIQRLAVFGKYQQISNNQAQSDLQSLIPEIQEFIFYNYGMSIKYQVREDCVDKALSGHFYKYLTNNLYQFCTLELYVLEANNSQEYIDGNNNMQVLSYTDQQIGDCKYIWVVLAYNHNPIKLIYHTYDVWDSGSLQNYASKLQKGAARLETDKNIKLIQQDY